MKKIWVAKKRHESFFMATAVIGEWSFSLKLDDVTDLDILAWNILIRAVSKERANILVQTMNHFVQNHGVDNCLLQNLHSTASLLKEVRALFPEEAEWEIEIEVKRIDN